ncbi:MAG: MBL fold metallo-hydrolase, partial [Myxococcales bacterium]|nr:MBL fold metallo-hydrolase [Myxococcales bacterium]
WDHIQGFPFFAPAFVAGNAIHMYGGAPVWGTLESVMAGQMEFPNFPVKLDQLSSNLVFHDIKPGAALEPAPGVRVTTAAGFHPGGVVAYRVDYDGRSLAYMTDTEYGTDADRGLEALAKGVDVLIYDCMYTPEEYRGEGSISKKGWGHSTYEGGVAVAKAAGAKQLVLFHHDPDQSDDDVRAKEARTKALFPAATAAREGLSIDIG